MGMNNRLLVPRASGINPKSISGLSAWWDFSDSSQITLNGSTISQILDKSGSGRTASQSTAAAQPTLTTNAQNGKSMATFNNSSTRLTYDTDLFTFTGAATIFVVCRDIVVALEDYAGFVSEYRGNGTSVVVAPALYEASGGTNRGFRPGLDGWAAQTLDTSSNYGSPTQTSPSVVQFYWENWSTHRTNGTTLIGINNDSVSLTSRGGTVSTFSTSASRREIGSASGGVFNSATVLNGRIGEILVYTAALSSSQRSNVRKYLGSKWGIAVT